MGYPRHSHITDYSLLHVATVAASSTPVGTNTHGSHLGAVTVNTAGSSVVLTLYDGANVVAVISAPVAGASYRYDALLRHGLNYTASGAGFDLTISYADVSAA